jgi:hypothetical protein
MRARVCGAVMQRPARHLAGLAAAATAEPLSQRSRTFFCSSPFPVTRRSLAPRVRPRRRRAWAFCSCCLLAAPRHGVGAAASGARAPALLCVASLRSFAGRTRLRILTSAACRTHAQVWSKPGAPPPPSQAAPPAEATPPPAAHAAAPSASHRRCFGDDAGGGRAMLLLKLLLAVLLASAVAISGSLSYSLGAWHRVPRRGTARP